MKKDTTSKDQGLANHARAMKNLLNEIPKAEVEKLQSQAGNPELEIGRPNHQIAYQSLASTRQQ